jgi:hypothetical protein
MAKSTAVKSLTLVSFIMLLTGFITFRTGAFDKYLKAEDQTLPLDTPETRHSPSMLSTSKSITVVEQELEFSLVDSNEVFDHKEKSELVDTNSVLNQNLKWSSSDLSQADSALADKIRHSPAMMSGSKYSISLDQQLKFKVREKEKQSPAMIGSSKSMTLTDQQLKFLSTASDSALKEQRKLEQNDSLKIDSLKDK